MHVIKRISRHIIRSVSTSTTPWEQIASSTWTGWLGLAWLSEGKACGAALFCLTVQLGVDDVGERTRWADNVNSEAQVMKNERLNLLSNTNLPPSRSVAASWICRLATAVDESMF